MKKKKGIIIAAPILPLSAKIELVARFLRKAVCPKNRGSKVAASQKAPPSPSTDSIAKKHLPSREHPAKKTESA